MKALIVGITFLFIVPIFSFVFAGEPVRIIVFGAHPDDCDISAGGTTALFSQMGHKVKFVSLTNGDKGHHQMQPEALAARRKQEMQEAASCLGCVYVNLDNHDGELMPTLENRKEVIRLICDWKADIVITHRPNDYHPDHRYTSIIVQDAAYMISVPLMIPEGKPLLKSPVFLYMYDNFRKPTPFSSDIVVDITPVAERKLDAICAHESQVYEWLPWNSGYEKEIPADVAGKRKFVSDYLLGEKMSDKYREPTLTWYSPEQVKEMSYFEAFEICEYGNIPDKAEILRLFPMLPR